MLDLFEHPRCTQCGHHDQRNLLTRRTRRVHDLQPGHPRHRYVGHDEVERSVLGERDEQLVTGLRTHDLDPEAFDGVPHDQQHLRVVIRHDRTQGIHQHVPLQMLCPDDAREDLADRHLG